MAYSDAGTEEGLEAPQLDPQSTRQPVRTTLMRWCLPSIALALMASSADSYAPARVPVCSTGDAALDAEAKLVMQAIFSQPGDRYRPYRFAGPRDPASFLERTLPTRADTRPIDARWPHLIYYQYPDQLSLGTANFISYVATDASTVKRLISAEKQWGWYERAIAHDADGASIKVAPLTYVPQDRSRYVPMIKQADSLRQRSPALRGTQLVTDSISLQCMVAAYYRGDDLVSVVTILNPWWTQRPTEKGTYPNLGVHLRMCDRRAHALLYGFKNLDLAFFWRTAMANGATGTVRANTLPDLPPGWADTFLKMRGLRTVAGSSPTAVCTRVKQLLTSSR